MGEVGGDEGGGVVGRLPGTMTDVSCKAKES